MLTLSLALNVFFALALLVVLHHHLVNLRDFHTYAMNDLLKSRDEFLKLVAEIRDHFKAKP